eukprot:SAG11_NODE_11196_length_777_cov_1.278761_1_plen_54_part_10
MCKAAEDTSNVKDCLRRATSGLKRHQRITERQLQQAVDAMTLEKFSGHKPIVVE